MGTYRSLKNGGIQSPKEGKIGFTGKDKKTLPRKVLLTV